MLSVSPSSNEVCAVSSSKAELNKECFVECPIKCTTKRRALGIKPDSGSDTHERSINKLAKSASRINRACHNN
jgi:hypothetical protein